MIITQIISTMCTMGDRLNQRNSNKTAMSIFFKLYIYYVICIAVMLGEQEKKQKGLLTFF